MSRFTTIVIAGAALAAASLTSAQAMPVQVDRDAAASTILVAGGCGPGGHRGPYGGCRPNGWRPGWRGYHRGWGPGYRRGWGPGWRGRHWHRRYVY